MDLSNYGDYGCGTIITGIIIAIIIGFVFSIIFALPVMWLWNWLMPSIFGLTKIGFWKAWGLSLLCGFLFRSSNMNLNKNK